MLERGEKMKKEEHLTLKHIQRELLHKQNQRHLFYEKNKFYGFKKITEERKNAIAEKAQLWLLNNQEMNNSDKLFAIYHLLNQVRETKEKPEVFSSLGIALHDESFLFLLFAFDPSLKLLQISYETPKKEEIKKRFEEEFGVCYDSRLLTIETYYNKRFLTIIDENNKKL